MFKISLYLTAIFVAAAIISCTYSIILTDTHGTATDVVDETTTPTTDVSPTITVPVSPM